MRKWRSTFTSLIFMWHFAPSSSIGDNYDLCPVFVLYKMRQKFERKSTSGKAARKMLVKLNKGLFSCTETNPVRYRGTHTHTHIWTRTYTHSHFVIFLSLHHTRNLSCIRWEGKAHKAFTLGRAKDMTSTKMIMTGMHFPTHAEQSLSIPTYHG